MTLKNIFNRIKPSLGYITKKATDITVAIYALAGLVSLFVSFEGIFKNNTTFLPKILISISILAAIWFICFILITIFVICSSKKKVADLHNGHALYVTYGDLFDPQIVKTKDKTQNQSNKRYICFSVNRCFDTIVDDHLITSQTIHGIAFKNLCKKMGDDNASKLDNMIQESLSTNKGYEEITRNEKPEGNLKRYEVGTCADLMIDEELHYLLLGLSTFDKELKAQTTMEDYVLAIQKIVIAIDTYSNGFPVLMPIIGTGRSRTNINENDALRYMIEAFKINKNQINSDIYIVIKESDKNRISIFDL